MKAAMIGDEEDESLKEEVGTSDRGVARAEPESVESCLGIKPDEDGTALPDTATEEWDSNKIDFEALVASSDTESLLSALEGPELFRSACDDSRYFDLAMAGIGVVAWAEPARASALLLRYDVDRQRQDPDSTSRTAGRSLMLAMEWRQLHKMGVFESPGMVENQASENHASSNRAKFEEALASFLRVESALGHRSEEATKLRELMDGNPEEFAELCHRIGTQGQVLPIHIVRSAKKASKDEPSLGVGNANEAIDTLLKRFAKESRFRLLALIAAGLSFTPFVISPGGVGIVLSLLLLGGALSLLDNRNYSRSVRPTLVQLAASYGVSPRNLLQRFPDAKVLGNFALHIENDHELDLLASLRQQVGDSPP